MENNAYKGRIAEVRTLDYPGAWDNFALPTYSYSALVVQDDGTSSWVYLGNGDGPNPFTPDCTPELLERYNAVQAKLAEAERLARAEAEKNNPRIGKVMQVNAGKNKGFVGTVKWVGTTKFGASTLLIDDAGKKVFTKPSNLTLIAPAPETQPIALGAKVTIKMGQHAGKSGTVKWMGHTKYGYKALVITTYCDVWAKLGNLELSDESEVKALIA